MTFFIPSIIDFQNIILFFTKIQNMVSTPPQYFLYFYKKNAYNTKAIANLYVSNRLLYFVFKYLFEISFYFSVFIHKN